MSRLNIAINYYEDFAPDKKPYNEFKLHQCIYYHQKVADFYHFERLSAYAMMGFCYDLLGEEEKAVKAYQASLKANPNGFWPAYNLGLGAYKKKEYQKAVEYFQQAIDKDSKVNLYILARSKVYMDIKLSDPKHRKDDFLELLKQGRVQAYIYLMDSLAQLKDYTMLFSVAMLGLRENSEDHGIFYYYAGWALFYQQQLDKAIELLQVAVAKNPNNADAFLYLSMCMKIVGTEELAKALFDQAKQIEEKEGSLIKRRLNSGTRFF
jgi:tetratricopeptide (TPR) repeat protein